MEIHFPLDFLRNLGKQKPLYPDHYKEEDAVRRSLDQYLGHLSRSGEFHDRLSSVTKAGYMLNSDQYRLAAYSGSGEGKYPHSNFYFDTPFNVLLLSPNRFRLHIRGACIGFQVEKDADTDGRKAGDVVIRQLQGIHDARTRDFLRPLRWEKLMIGIIEDWAGANDFPRLCIVSAEANEYYYKDDIEKTTSRNRRLIRRYNTTAERLGFEREADYYFRTHTNSV